MREVFMQAETLKQQISAAKGEVDAELVLKRAKVVNVFTNEIEEADVAIHHGKIIGVGFGRKICLSGFDRWSYSHRKLHALWAGI